MSARLDEALRAAEIPESSAAKDRTKVLARAAIMQRESPVDGGGAGVRWPRIRILRAAIATGVAMSVAVLAATPPGQSAAAWVGDLVGIGDDPEPEVVAVDSATIGSGTGPRGERFQLVASSPRSGSGEVCLSLDWPEQRKATTTCGYPPDQTIGGMPIPPDQTALGTPFLYSAEVVGLADELGSEVGIVHGNAASDVVEVRVAYHDAGGGRSEVQAQLFALEGTIAQQVRAPAPLKGYVAFVPVTGLDSAEVKAYDSDGEPAGTYAGGDRLDSAGDRRWPLGHAPNSRAPTPRVERAE